VKIPAVYGSVLELFKREYTVKKGAHIDQQTMLSLLAGGGKSAAVHDHMSHCSRCRDRHEKLARILMPSHNTALEPSRGVEKRILATYRTTYKSALDDAPMFNILAILTNWNRRALAGALAAMILMIGASVMIYRDRAPQALPLYVYSMKGQAFINGEPVSYRSTIMEGSLLEVPRNSVVVLSYKDRFLLKVHEGSELRLGKAIMKRRGGQKEFVFNLIRGTLFTRINNESDEPDYFYMTPNARIKSSRTEFILKVTGNRTILIPRSGTINITSLETREEVLTLPDRKYVITSSIETSENGEDEEIREQLIDDAENSFNEDEQREIRNVLEPMS
jgi:hypothetical protein